MGELFDELNKLAKSDILPLHMPGHKRREEAEFFQSLYALDITEIEPFDNLHDAKGMIKRVEERAAELWDAKESHLLVNGSTCGNLVAVFATSSDGDEMLIARNSHTSVYHALELRRIKAHYIYPTVNSEFDICLGIKAQQVEQGLEEHPNTRAVLITSPTYEGYVSEISEIAKLCHRKGIPLIVDEAHGAHFGFDGYFPQTAVRLGADIVIQSLHKTLPSMTQTAVLHIGNTDFIDVNKVRKYLTYFQTASPSYIFLASMEHCLDVMEEKGSSFMKDYATRLESFYKEMAELESVRILEPQTDTRDPGKLLLRIKGRTGKELADELLSQFQIQCEMCSPEYVLLMTSIYDTNDTFTKMKSAVKELDAEGGTPFVEISVEEKSSMETPERTKILKWEDCRSKCEAQESDLQPQPIYTLSEAAEHKSIKVKLAEAEGRICGRAVYLYPSGTPFILPGERFTEGILAYITSCREAGFEVKGAEDGEVWVLE